MQWAEGGSLDDFIDSRLGRGTAAQIHHMHPSSSRAHSRKSSQEEIPTAQPTSPYSRGARIRAFRAMQHASPEERERLRREMPGESDRAGGSGSSEMKAVHLLSAEEVKSLFQDVVEGLAFLVSQLSPAAVTLAKRLAARQVHSSSRLEAGERVVDVG